MAQKKSKVQKEISLESILWNCRVALRGTIGGNEKNRDAVLSLVFLKFVGEKFDKQREKLLAQYGDVPAFLEKVSFYRSDNVFYIPETARWNYIVSKASQSDIAVILDTALKDIQEKNTDLVGALPTNFYVSNLGGKQKEIKSLIDEVNKIDEAKFAEKDLIGRVYEYFLQAFSIDSTGQENGEFYTPASIVELIAELIEPYDGVVYDPCCGSGGMFVQSIKFVERHNGNRTKISVRGQESNPDTWRLAKLNLAIRGISHDLGKEAVSTFSNDQHTADRYSNHPMVDYIMANPPFNLKKWRGEDELTTDARWSGYAVPPVSNANYAWILQMLSKLDVNNGIAGFLLANGALNADGIEKEVRQKLVENDKIEAIIVLPREMFYSTDISVTLWIMNNNKKARSLNGRQLRDRQKEMLFMDLRRWNGNIYEKKFVMFTDEQIAKVKAIYNAWQTGCGYKDIPELCKSATIADIETQNFSLAPSKYIEFIDHDLKIDYHKEMQRIQAEMKYILAEEKHSQTMLENAFAGIGFNIGGESNG
jgi:type I restriction enzyme M protein